jgi:Fur family iron response transcriptional regulator
MKQIHSKDDVVALLRSRDINPTSQRIEIAYILFAHHGHYSAEDVFTGVNKAEQHVSKATVYNTLGLFAEKGLVREVIVDPTKVFYDPNVAPHHHFYNVATGELADIEGDHVQVSGLPPLPEGAAMEGVDVIVRLRPAS